MNRWSSLSDPDRASLEAEQIDMELRSLDIGVQRYRRMRTERDASRGTPERRLIAKYVKKVSARLAAEQDSVLDKEAGAGKAHWGYPLLTLDPDKLAVIALVGMLNLGDDQRAGISTMLRTLGGHVETEYNFERLKKEERKLYDVVSKKIKNWTPRQVGYMKKKLANTEKPWPMRVRTWVGYKLVEAVCDETDLFDHEPYSITTRGRTRRQYKVVLNPKIRAELEAQHSNCEVLQPWYLPMLTPPNDWAFGEQGGYRYHAYPMVKPQNLYEDQSEPEVEHGPVIYRTINAVQQTGYRVNQRVLEVMAQVWTAGGGYAGIPLAEPKALPPRPRSKKPEKLAEWKILARMTHEENARTVGKRASTLSKLRTADRFRKYDEFFFPWQFDYRGRLYPVGSDLHPQSDDMGRGLMEFSVGKPLGKRGLYWLKVRLANEFGVDKVSFDERVAWADKHIADIMATAADPLDHKWWVEADDPWQALATCFALSEAFGYCGDGTDVSEYVCHLPVQMDGTCNGLQHFAAMCRDPAAAEMVNLAPSDKPSDIYDAVAKLVYQRVEADLHEILNDPDTDDPEGHPAAEWHRTGITRKTVKRSTMTVPYGVTRVGMQDQFVTDGWTEGMNNPGKAARYLMQQTWDVLSQEVVASARTVMDWLKVVANTTGKKNLPISWVTPSGFRIKQEALRTKESSIYTVMQRVSLYPAEPGKISANRQQLCMPPNFVHSLDAAHMALTICECLDRGVTSFAMIHDSYGTHACDVDDMAAALRYRFVRMYQDDLLHGYWQQWTEETGIELPEPPGRGEFDLALVLESSYFFG